GGDLPALGGGGVGVVGGQVLDVAAGHEGGGTAVEAEPVGGPEAGEEIGGLGQGHARGAVVAGVDGDEHDLPGGGQAAEGPGGVAPIAPTAPVARTIRSVSAPSGVSPPQAGV